MNLEQLLSCALDIGEQMIISGAEINRAEATVRLICTAYGCRRAEVFIITSSIVTTVEGANGQFASQSRRIMGNRTDLTKLDQLNALSREICANTPEYVYVQSRVQAICSSKPFPFWVEVMASALIAAAFTLFFGGAAADSGWACFLGAGLRCITWLAQKAGLNQFFSNILSSFLLSVAAIVMVQVGLIQDVHTVLIGNIMLLIPGIGFTNAMRDMLSGDITSGMLRLLDAVLIAAAIAAGYVLAVQLMGGLL